jgi:hypothetical protein
LPTPSSFGKRLAQHPAGSQIAFPPQGEAADGVLRLPTLPPSGVVVPGVSSLTGLSKSQCGPHHRGIIPPPSWRVKENAPPSGLRRGAPARDSARPGRPLQALRAHVPG